MDEILYRAATLHGVEYGEFLSGIRRAMALCGSEDMSEAEFVRTLVAIAVQRFANGEEL